MKVVRIVVMHIESYVQAGYELVLCERTIDAKEQVLKKKGPEYLVAYGGTLLEDKEPVAWYCLCDGVVQQVMLPLK